MDDVQTTTKINKNHSTLDGCSVAILQVLSCTASSRYNFESTSSPWRASRSLIVHRLPMHWGSRGQWCSLASQTDFCIYSTMRSQPSGNKITMHSSLIGVKMAIKFPVIRRWVRSSLAYFEKWIQCSCSESVCWESIQESCKPCPTFRNSVQVLESSNFSLHNKTKCKTSLWHTPVSRRARIGATNLH